jgi:glutamate formiminotransferase
VLECVVNISEGRDHATIEALASAAGDDLLDLHTDPHHHRSVLTLVGTRAPRRVATEAIARLDLTDHHGVHPRLGVVDVVPFVPLEGSSLAEAVDERDSFASWLASEHDVPVFCYGPERSLPDLRRGAFRGLAPDAGPTAPHPTAGACCVGARDVLVAYNVWLDGVDLATARAIAARVRRPDLRALGLAVGEATQVSMNLIDPSNLGPADAFDLVADEVAAAGGAIGRAELVGLLPRAVLRAVPPARWSSLDLSDQRTIEARRSTG